MQEHSSEKGEVELPHFVFLTSGISTETLPESSQERLLAGEGTHGDTHPGVGNEAIFTNREKWLIVGMVAFAGIFRWVNVERGAGSIITDKRALSLPTVPLRRTSTFP